MGVSCVYESCTNHRPQSREAQNFGLYQKFDPSFISWTQQSPGHATQRRRPLAAQVPRSHSRATDQSSEFRTPALDRGNSSFFLSLSSFPTPSPFIFYFYPSHQPLSSPRPASTGGSQLGSLSFQMTINPNSKRRRQCSIQGSGNNKEEGDFSRIRGWQSAI